MASDYYNIYSGALRAFNNFDAKCNNASADFTYIFDAPEYKKLISKYHIDEVAGNGSELDKALNLMKWCAENVLHNGGTKDVEFVPKTSVDILDYAFKKGKEFGVYCRLQSIVFTECCLALGIKSRILHCLPFSPNDFDSHVVSIVWIENLKKWIMLDSGNGRYFMDSDNNILSPIEIRTKMALNEEIKCNEDDENYKLYMAKNLFYFKSLQINTYGSDLLDNQNEIYCIPTGFDVLDREVAYCEYAIKNSPTEFVDDWKKALAEYKGRTSFIGMTADNFFA